MMRAHFRFIFFLLPLLVVACQENPEKRAEQVAIEQMMRTVGIDAVNRSHIEVRPSAVGWMVVFSDAKASCKESSLWPGACRFASNVYRDVYACVERDWRIRQIGGSGASESLAMEDLCQAPLSEQTATPALTAIMSDLMPSIEIVQRALAENRPDLLRSLIGNEGVAATGFAMGANFKGFNNADEIIAAFSDALDKSKPVCVGFVPNAGTLPDKAILVYRNLALDWSQFDVDGDNADGLTIQLFKLPEGWQFVYITPFDFDVHSDIIGPLQDCPFD